MQNSKIQKAKKPKHAMKAPKANVDLGGGDRPTAAEFLRDRRWANVFIPTITHALYISRDPFLDFTSESPVFLATVQEVFDLSFPNVNFVLVANDPLVVTVQILCRITLIALLTMACRLINELTAESPSSQAGFLKRLPSSSIIILLINQKTFETTLVGLSKEMVLPITRPPPLKPLRSLVMIQATRWVLCLVLLSTFVMVAHQAPDGFLQSQFIAPTAEQCLKYAKNSVLIPPLDAKHPPKGLYALLLTAVRYSDMCYGTRY